MRIALKTPALWLGLLFVTLLTGMPGLSPVFGWAFPRVRPAVFDRAGFVELFLSHLGLVAAASTAAALAGVAAAVFATRPAGRDFRTIAALLAAAGQTFPPAAVLALAVPALGFGARPTVVALFVYGLLPVVENAIAGIEGVPEGLREAAQGMGMTPWQVLRRVELPLAAPVILAGVRVSVTVAIGTATIGSTVGALTLGTPIFDGLAGNKLPYVLQGAVLVALFAVVTDLLFAVLARRLQPADRR
ncbi:MAG: ABC transporter permease [Alphaproteobacteria bacterium]|nr:ABC transporter permease [Alphaproteobacteria bacterium]MBV9555353.1 ABC transporter permease [Alphaproteobacteria bacterium]